MTRAQKPITTCDYQNSNAQQGRNEINDMNNYTWTLGGGHNYRGGIEIDAPCIADAADAWFDRWSSNGQRRIEGVFWPCFGDMDDDDYAVMCFDTEQSLTRKQVLEMMDCSE